MSYSGRGICRRAAFLIFLAFVVTGCASKMPISPDRPIVLNAQDGLAVFTMGLKNEFKNYLLTPASISLEASPASGGKSYRFSFGTPERKISDRELQVLGSFALPPGDYEIKSFAGGTDLGFALLPVRGFFEPVFKRSFRVRSGESVYLGHIEARLVEKTSSDEDRAGPLLPVVDQAATGMSTGTFKFRTLDRYDEDINYIKTRYPPLSARQFTKRLLTDAPELDPQEPSMREALVENRNREKHNQALSKIQIQGECSVSQILEMKKLGLSDLQIKKSCS